MEPFVEAPVVAEIPPPVIEQTETGLDSLAQKAYGKLFGDQKMDLNSTFASVSGTNPDEAAKAQSVGIQVGVGQDLAMRNMAEVKKSADQKQFESYDLMGSNPVLARQMMNRDFASVAHDDIPQLTSLGGLFKVLGAAATGQPFPPEVAMEIAQQFGGSQYQTEEALIYHWMSNNGLEEKDLSEETRQRLKTLEENAPPPINTYLFGGVSYAAGQMFSMAPEVSKYALTGAVTGAALTAAGGPLAIGGTLGGAGLGATAGIGVVTSQIEGGMLYKELLRNKVPKDVARTVSSIGGTVNGLIEIGTLGLATAPFKAALKKVVGETIIKRGIQELAKPTAISAIKTASKYYGMEVLGEQVQEISQEMTSIVAEDVAGRYTPGEFESKFSTPEGLQELANRLLDVSEQTFKATAIMGSFGPVLNLAVDAKNIRDSAKTKQFLTDLSKNVQATKLKGRSPSALANFVAAQAQGTAAETMYVDAEEMVNVLNQSGLTAQQIDNALPGIREQLAQATSGGDIQIPTAQFAANIVGTKLEAPLMEHARLAPDAISAKQAIAQQETMQQNMKDAQVEMAVQEKVNAQFVREAKEIEKVVNDQLVAAGRPATEALFAAKLVQARAVTGAAAAGITPAQWVAQHPVPTFQSQQQATQQAPAQGSFEQASRADLGLGEQTIRKVDGNLLRKLIRKLAKQDISAEDLINDADLSGLVTEEEVYDLTEREQGMAQVGATFGSRGTTSLPAGFDSGRGTHPLILLARERAKIQASKGFNESNYRPKVVRWAQLEFGDRIAPDGSSVWQNFTEWFGDSKVVDAEGKPMVVYHGTKSNFLEFRNDRPIWVAETASHAGEFVAGGRRLMGEKPKKGSTIYPLFVSIKNPIVLKGFEYGGKTTVEQILAENNLPYNEDALRRIAKSNIDSGYVSVSNQVADPISYLVEGYRTLTPIFNILDNSGFIKSLVNAGFDGIKTEEVSAKTQEKSVTYAAFEPTQIKSAIANVGTFGQQDPNILRQEAISEQQPGANSPGVGVEEKPKLGFWKPFRVKVTSDVEIPKKPLILTGTKNSNAQKQLVNIDGILEKFPNAGESVDEWTNMMAYALGSDEVPIPPYAFIKGINGNGSFETLSKLTAGQIADASYGFENAKEIREAYTSGQLDVTFTAKLILWSFLSRGVSPYTQESLFIDAFNGSAEWIDKASKGEFTEANFPAYEEWAKSVAPKGSGQPGAGATHNLNAFGQDFLFKMSRIGENGKSHLQNLHEMFSDPNQTGKKIRREFSKFGEGVGIDNKVISFTLLVAGFSDVMILDRVQIRQLWDDGRFQGVNLYDGSKNEEGNKISGSSMNDITEGVRGILVYEALERQLEKRIGALYEKLGRPQDASTGRYHWETWVAFSEQEASHGTLMAILKDAKGDDQAISNVASKQGEYGTYEYGTLYNRDKNGTPWFKYETPSGNSYSFSVLAFREFLANIKQPKNGVVPTKFKVTESGNAPWYTRPEINKQQLDTQAAKWADLAGGTGEGKRITDETIQRDIANRARSSADAESIAKSWEIPTKPAGLGTIQSKLFAGGEATKFARSNRESNGTHFSYERSPVGNVEGSRLLGVPTVGAFTAGSGLAELYKKSGNATPTFYELRSSVASAERFHSAISDNKSASKFGAAVAVYSVEDYKEMRLFLSEDGNSGVAIKPDGDIVSVFSSGGAGRSLMELAVSAGGKKLDAFDTVLPHFYAPHGFVVASRMDWNEEFKPEGWNKETFSEFNGGSPDVVFMSRDDSFTGKYNPTDGTKFEDYDKAVEKQQEFINVINKPLFQAATGGARGSMDPVNNLINLGKNADALTTFHELMHWFVVDLFRTATDSAASELSKSDADILLKWFGIGGSNMQERIANWNAMTLEEQRQHHETTAYNAEIWVATGRAPSVELQGVFERFRRWATRVYKSIRDDLNEIYRQQFGTDLPFLTDEVRGVFDRMLASEEQIARREAIDNFKGMYQTQEESGMNDATWAAYQAELAEAHEMAVTDLTKATVKQMEWLSGARKGILKTMQAAHNSLRRSVQGEESNKMDNEPVRKAERFFKTGKMVDPDGKEIEVLVGNKIDSVAVGGMYPTSTTGLAPAVDLTKLRGMTMEGGLAPDLAAEMFGFSSGDELIRALAELKPFKDELKERTDARMLDEHGGMNTEAEKEEAVNKALANEVRARMVAIENRYLTKVKTPVAVIMQGAKELARTILGRMAIKDIKPRNYVAAEARVAKDKHTAVKAMQSPETAGKSAYTRSFNEQIAAGVEESVAASEALVKSVEAIKRAQAKIDAHKKQYGDVDPAIVAKKASHQQVIQNQLAKEGYKILEEVEKQVSLFKRFFKDDKKIAATRNMDLVNAARSILAFYGLGKHDKLPSAYLKQIEQYNPGLFETISAMVNEAQVGTPDYRLLTFEEFQSMQETVDALWQLAKRENQIKIEGEMVSLGQATEKLEQRLDVIGVPTTIAGETQAVTFKDRAVRHINSMKAMLRRIEHWADATDGAGNVGGPFTKYIWRPISQALDAYRIDRNKYVKRYVELLKQVPLPAGKIAAPELNYTFGAGNGGIGIAELLGAIMHSGNISNLEKLLIGRKWATVSEDGTMDTSRWDAFVARVSNDGTLTKEHFDFIQAVWDLNEELKPMVQKAHYDIEGYYFKEVEATPFTNRFGNYRGGYVPAKTDPFIVRDAQRQLKMSELESDFRAAMPSTGAGFTKSRVKYNKALSLDIRLMAKHIDDVIRYSHVQPAVKDVLRILKKSSFADKLTQMDSMAIDEMLTPWLNRAARQITSESGRWKPIDTFWRTVRSRTGISVMIGNITNALQQATGLFMAAIKVVKTAHLGNAFYAYFSSPRQAAQEVAALSPFMSNRMQNQIFDLQDQMNELILNPNKFQKIQKWSSHHGYFLQSAFQNMVDIVTWTGAYNQHLAESGVEVSDADAQREAVNRADAAVRLTQGTMNPEGLAAFEVGTPFYKTFIQFTGYFNMLANLNTDEYVKIFRDLGWRGNEGKLAYTFLMGFAAQAIISDAIVKTMRGGWEDDDDDGYLDVFMDWIFGSMGRSAVAMVPFGSTGMTAVSQILMPIIKGKAGTGYDDRIQSSPSVSALTSSTIGVGRAILDVVSEDKEVTGQDVKDVMTLISLTTGVPVTLLGRPVSYLVDVNRGKVEPTSTADLMRGLITGTATKESKKR